MRTLLRNRQTFWYARYTGKAPIVDADGNETGEYTTTHSDPVKAMGNIDPAVGVRFAAAWGSGASYDHRIIPEDANLPIQENDYVWIGVPTTGPHNYIVTTIGRSLNFLLLNVKKVNTSA